MPPGTAASPMTTKRIHREVADLKKEDLGAMTLAPSDDNLFLWKGQIPGPSGSVYEGGMFDLDVTLASDYPFTAPRVTFKTRIYHMNISERGDICIDILKHNWSPALSLFKVLLSLSSLLTDPNPRDPLVGAIANQYTSNRQMHDSTARQWTKLYAMPKPPPPPPAASYSKATTTPAASTRARGKATASSSANSTNTNPSSSSSTSRFALAGTQDTITIEDSDNEDGPQSTRMKAGAKRKRRSGASGQTNGESLDDDGEIEFVEEGRRRKRSTRTTPAERGRHVHDSDVIVIDDD
ncbi:ubiquitin-conjugating enzyme/RWD-like protein [Lentinula detonsa]|uniref:E2 ubiquitin-conjugating enzyme n=1 Tax=Lentinula detonsa TaxID=2804962 RepID=A0A9W8NSN3_9AGAR|nr:ubiquitin-conjugating enzyme/RWD-like protein [Lentinula detonsa]KAJ3981471.1 ubiquitin-conjugating enzyme/RWD-like protein [Lentinula detonsa]